MRAPSCEAKYSNLKANFPCPHQSKEKAYSRVFRDERPTQIRIELDTSYKA